MPRSVLGCPQPPVNQLAVVMDLAREALAECSTENERAICVLNRLLDGFCPARASFSVSSLTAGSERSTASFDRSSGDLLTSIEGLALMQVTTPAATTTLMHKRIVH